MRGLSRQFKLPQAQSRLSIASKPVARSLSTSRSHGSKKTPPARVSDAEIARLADMHLHPLSLADLVKHGRPPLSTSALLSSANFTLSLLPIRLAHRIRAMRNLPFIVVSNPNISRIHDNYVHSLSTLLPWLNDASSSSRPHAAHDPPPPTTHISTPGDEARFTEALAELVATHTDTIPILARGFLESRRYVAPDEVTRFLDEHLRARIGTRLVAEQHIALHFCSTGISAPADPPFVDEGAKERGGDEGGGGRKQDENDRAGAGGEEGPASSYIGVIDTALRPAQTIDACAGFVADICELRYGVRPTWRIVDGGAAEGGDTDAELHPTTFAFVPMHLEYIVTELLKNAFRATVENGAVFQPVEITIAPDESEAALGPLTPLPPPPPQHDGPDDDHHRQHHHHAPDTVGTIAPMSGPSPGGVTIRIRDRGGGIAPEVLPNIWGYSFTTFSDADDVPGGAIGGIGDEGLNAISAGGGGSSIAGLGYGLPLTRAYAEYFGGGIAVQSLYGWGTDVYLRLKGVGKIE